MRQILALVAIAAGLVPSFLAFNGGLTSGISVLCGLALFGVSLALAMPDSEINQLKLNRDNLQTKLESLTADIGKLETQVKQKESAIEAQAKLTKEAEAKHSSAQDQIKVETAKHQALSDQLTKALVLIEKIQSESQAIAEAVDAVKEKQSATSGPDSNSELQQVETQIGQFTEEQGNTERQLEHLVSNLNSNLEVLVAQNVELAELNSKLGELRSKSASGDFVQDFSVVVANLALKGARSSSETEAANSLQLLNQRLKNRDEMLRVLASALEQQTTQIAMRSESTLKAIGHRLEEAQGLQAESAKLSELLSGLSSTLASSKTEKKSNETSEIALPATDGLRASVTELAELSKTWNTSKRGA